MLTYIMGILQKLKIIKGKKLETYKSVEIKSGSVVILVPVGNHIEPAVDESLRVLEKLGYTVWRKYGFSAIDQGRCVLAQQALDAGFEHLVWIDADVSFWPYDVEKIISLGLPFVSAPYTVKGWPALTTVFNDDEILLGEHGKLYDIKYAATGFMYTHRSVYEKIVAYFDMKKVKIWGGQYQVYPYFYPLIIGDEYIGEDFAFCHRLREAGIKLFCDTRIVLAHIGKYSYSLGFMQVGPSKEPVKIKYKQTDSAKFS